MNALLNECPKCGSYFNDCPDEQYGTTPEGEAIFVSTDRCAMCGTVVRRTYVISKVEIEEGHECDYEEEDKDEQYD